MPWGIMVDLFHDSYLPFIGAFQRSGAHIAAAYRLELTVKKYTRHLIKIGCWVEYVCYCVFAPWQLGLITLEPSYTGLFYFYQKQTNEKQNERVWATFKQWN